jgi:hydrogenase maturation protease
MIRFEDVLADGACLVGTGNPWRRDDGVGPWLAESLEGAGLPVFNAEDVLENHVYDIARTDCRNVVIMDAVAADLEPGAVVFARLDGLREPAGPSTHKLALGLCGKILEAHGKRTYLLGIVPRDLDFGRGLTEEVERAASGVRDLILRARAGKHEEHLHER